MCQARRMMATRQYEGRDFPGQVIKTINGVDYILIEMRISCGPLEPMQGVYSGV